MMTGSFSKSLLQKTELMIADKWRKEKCEQSCNILSYLCLSISSVCTTIKKKKIWVSMMFLNVTEWKLRWTVINEDQKHIRKFRFYFFIHVNKIGRKKTEVSSNLWWGSIKTHSGFKLLHISDLVWI